MPMNLSIKNVPDAVVARLKKRAKNHHRSMQGELLALVTSAASEPSKPKLTVEQVVAKVRKLGLESHDEAARMIREDRDR